MIQKTNLEADRVRLEPLGKEHVNGLFDASDQTVWKYMPIHVASRDDIASFIQRSQRMHADGTALAFAVIEKTSGEVAGSTGYWSYVAEHKRVEIGFTWYAPKWQRTHVNTSCKLLLLTHAFEEMNLNRVEFKTDSLNERSRAAIGRIGAVEEGIFRNHVIQPDGRLRHSVYFSIINEQWPDVKARLLERLKK